MLRRFSVTPVLRGLRASARLRFAAVGLVVLLLVGASGGALVAARGGDSGSGVTDAAMPKDSDGDEFPGDLLEPEPDGDGDAAVPNTAGSPDTSGSPDGA